MARVIDERTFEISHDDVCAHLPNALARAFGSRPEPLEHGRWRIATTRAGVAHDVLVATEPNKDETTISIEVEARRGRAAWAKLSAATLITALSWLVTAIFVIGAERLIEGGGRFLAGVPAFGTALLLSWVWVRILRSLRVHALGALEPMEKVWHSLDEMQRAPRVDGIRVKPRIAIAADEDGAAEEQALAEHEAATLERDRAARRR